MNGCASNRLPPEIFHRRWDSNPGRCEENWGGTEIGNRDDEDDRRQHAHSHSGMASSRIAIPIAIRVVCTNVRRARVLCWRNHGRDGFHEGHMYAGGENRSCYVVAQWNTAATRPKTAAVRLPHPNCTPAGCVRLPGRPYIQPETGVLEREQQYQLPVVVSEEKLVL